MAAIKMSDLPSYLKDYFQDVKAEFQQNLLIDNMPFEKFCVTENGVTDEIILSETIVGGVLQPGGKDSFTPKDDVINLKARKGKVQDVKIDLKWTPIQQKALIRSYLQHIQRQKLNYKDLPFGDWFLPIILSAAKNDLARTIVMKGVLNAAGTDPVDSFDGFITILNAAGADLNPGIDSANIVESPDGGMTQSVAVAEIEKLLDKVPASDLEYFEWAMVCDPEIMKLYNRGYRDEFGQLLWNKEFTKKSPDGADNVEFIGDPGLQGTGEIIFLRKPQQIKQMGSDILIPGPARWIINDVNDMEDITIEVAERNLKVMLDFQASVEFATLRDVYYYKFIAD